MTSNNDEHLLESKIDEKPKVDFMKLLKMSIYEFIGTFMFMSIIYYCNGDVTKFIFGFWVILSLFGGFSGAHVNPAITLGCYIYDHDWINGLYKLFAYWIVQFTGALFGALITKRFFTDLVYVGVPTNMSLGSVMYSEFFFTGTFLFVILWVCSNITTPTKLAPIKCAMIVGWFYMIVNAGSKLSGAAYNPAILFVLNYIAYEIKDPKALGYVGYMVISEFLGVVVFAFAFKYCFESYYKTNNKEEVEWKDPANVQLRRQAAHKN
jgi:aquaporin Z